MRTGVVIEPIFLEHYMGDGHPESPRRLQAIMEMLQKPDMDGRFKKIPARDATAEELGWIHSRSYIEQVAQTEGKPRVRLDGDTSTSPQSYKAALMAAGGLMEAVRLIFEGEVQNAFALVRPPGHHAESSRAMGFCLFNNVAIAAEYAIKKLGASRVAILDWDLHHGNGTQNSFYDRDDILYISTHQYPYYPGSGDFYEVGFDDGMGRTLNVPMAHGFGEGDYGMMFKELFAPVLREFAPDLLIVSAGFDIYENDPLGAMNVTPEGFGSMARILLDVAEEVMKGRIVFALEGGYHIGGLTEGVKSVLLEMEKEAGGAEAPLPQPLIGEKTKQLISQARAIYGQYWKSLT